MEKNNIIAKKQNPLLTANILNKLFFWWIADLIIYGTKCDLEEKDLYRILEQDQSATLKAKLQIAWSQECTSAFEKKTNPSLWKCLVNVYKWKFIWRCMIVYGFAVMQLMQPLLLEKILFYFQSPSEMSAMTACLYVSLSISLLIIVTILIRTTFFQLARLALNIRIACSSLIYRKLLRTSNSSIDKNTSISVINLLSTDVSKFEALISYLPFLFTIPVQIMIAIYFISKYVNMTSAIIGCLSLILQSVPGQVIYFKFITKLRAKQASETDKRISLISEVINGIQAVKMCVWERYFVNLVQIARKHEVHVFFKMSYFKSFMAACLHSAQRSCTFLVAVMYSFEDKSMSVIKLIPVAQYLSLLKEIVISTLNITIRSLADANTSITRIENFLLREELVPVIKMMPCNFTQSIIIEKGTASWDSRISENMLRDIDIKIECNQLCIVLGSVGAGKTTLLKLIMGEVPFISGNVYMNGKISYASQEPWLFNGSIKDNIIFGEKYCESRYNRIVAACSLVEDFKSLTFGDETLVGEKGASLSGGQCARVSLARAVYKDADIYLLDDPLSAVDTRVAKMLLENCIDDLLRNKTRILVTHNVQALTKAEKIILLNKGQIQYQGTFVNFQSSEHYSTSFCAVTENSYQVETENFLDINESQVMLETTRNEHEKSEPQETEELLAKGGIPKSLFLKYLRFSKSYLSLAILIFSSITVSSLCVGFDYWMVIWAENQPSHRVNTTQNIL